MDEAAQISEWHINDGFIKNNKKTVHMVGKFGELKTKSFVDTAPNTITTDGRLENFFWNYDTKTLMMMGIGGVD